MTRSQKLIRFAALTAFALPLLTGAAAAQERSNGGFLDNLFSRGEQPSQQGQGQAQGQPREVAQSDPGDASVRLDRMESALRQLTGTIEQLQYQNQQLQMQLKRMQEDTEYRLQQLGSKGAIAPTRGNQPGAPPAAPPPANPGRRGDVFDPSQQPNAPGAPRTLGNETVTAAPAAGGNEPPVGAPGGRNAGAPLDLSTLAGAGAAPTQSPQPVNQQSQQLPPVVRNAGDGGTQLATLPPSATPQDEYDMAYGYVLHKDYALAEQAFRDFLRKYPNEHLVPDAQYWLGESLFQRQRYRDAAESFLSVSTKFEKSGKAPDSLLRLGQSLAAMNQKEAACATLAEVGRKFPRASATVKRGVTSEQKRAHC
jgi:tol-pal system protein YbgF